MTKTDLARARKYFERSRAGRGCLAFAPAHYIARYGNKYNATDCALEAFELLERIWYGCLTFDCGAANCAQDVRDDMEALFR